MKSVRWSQQDGTGLEHLVMREDAPGAVIESAVVGEHEEGAFGLMYRIECDTRWQVMRLALRLSDGRTLDLHRVPCDQTNRHALAEWIDAEGVPQASLRGCIDVDLTATPFTNTLPIRRLRLQEGERHVIRVVYVQVPSLAVRAAEQAYCCIEPNRRYRYDGLDTHFTAELTVDADGFVLDYPGLFKREDFTERR
jgi:uncharacterized protein